MPAADGTARRPNVLFFFTDDQRFDTIHALGNPQIHTPAFDALVARGVAFTRAHIMGGTSPAVCMPSRAMLHTGRDLFGIAGEGQEIDPTHALMGETLRGAGYRTFGTGKWHNGVAAYARSFTDGAEIFFGGMGDHWNVPAYDFDPTGRYDTALPYVQNPHLHRKIHYRHCDHMHLGKHSTELFSDASIAFLESLEGDAPFFAYVSFMAPHDPRTMPRKYLNMYDPEQIELPPNFMGAHPFDNGELKIRDEQLEDWPRTPEAIRRHIAEYYAMITHLDAEIQRVLDALEETGRADDTIIVFAGDNGLAVGQHGLMGKQSQYDHSLRIPLIFAGPGVPAGETREQLVYLHDIFPTLCDLTGTQIPTTVQSRSLAAALRDGSSAVRDDLLFAYKDCQRAVRDDRYKLIEYAVQGRRTTQLFDLAEDPWELASLADDRAQRGRVARMRERLRTWQTEHGDTREMGQRFWDGGG